MSELLSYLPENYRKSRETVAFQTALQPEIDAVWEARNALLEQLSPYTATELGLPYWERALGLGICDGLSLDVRRNQIVVKLQGRGVITTDVLKTVAETMLGVSVTVTEIYGEYRIELEVPKGFVPGQNMAQLKERLREILPAHLDLACIVPVLGLLSLTPRLGPQVSVSPVPYYRPDQTNLVLGTTAWLGRAVSINPLPVDEYGPLE